jgi:hypothetical protein
VNAVALGRVENPAEEARDRDFARVADFQGLGVARAFDGSLDVPVGEKAIDGRGAGDGYMGAG